MHRMSFKSASFLDSSLAGAKHFQVGLDIGSLWVKGVALEKTKKELNLVKVAAKALPSNSISDKDITDRESVILTVQNVIEELNPKISELVISVAGNRIFSDKITVKKMAKASQQREQVMVQAEERIPMGTAGVAIDWFPITDAEVGKSIAIELVAARSDFIRHYVELIQDAGYTVIAVDVDGLALYNTFEFGNKIAPDAVICLMNLGYSITNLVFIANGSFFSMRDISVGLLSMWDTIQSEMRLSSEDMRALMAGYFENINLDAFRSAVESSIGDLKVSLDTAFTYLETITQGKIVNQIYLSGGGGLIPNLSSVLSDRLNIKTTLLNPFQNLTYDPTIFLEQTPDKIGALYAVAVGLALRAS